MERITVDFTTIQGHTITRRFKDDETKLVENIKKHIASGTVMYIGGGNYLNAQHIYTFRVIRE